MWHEISWKEYGEVSGSAMGLYYLVIGGLYYRSELRKVFTRYFPSLIHSFGRSTPKNPEPPEEVIPDIEPGLEEMRALVAQLAAEKAGKVKLVLTLNALIRKHFSGLNEPLRRGVTRVIGHELNRQGAWQLEPEELESLWI